MSNNTLPKPPGLQRRPSLTVKTGQELPLRAVSPPSVTESNKTNFRRRRLTKEFQDSDASAETVEGEVQRIDLSGGVPDDATAAPTRHQLVSRELEDKDAAEREAVAIFSAAGVLGTYSAHGIEPGENESDAPVAKINQDCGCVCFPVGDAAEPRALLVVMDGHGSCGELVSHTAMRGLVQSLEGSALLSSDPKGALEASFEAAQQALLDGIEAQTMATTGDPLHSGTTAIAVLLTPSSITVANSGDCRAVVGVAAPPGTPTAEPAAEVTVRQLNEEHKPDGRREQARVEAGGGFVRPSRRDEDGYVRPARLYYGPTARGPGLAISRAIGDVLARQAGLTHQPEVTHWTLGGGGDAAGAAEAAAVGDAVGDAASSSELDLALLGPRRLCAAHEDALFLIVGTDGLWELMPSQVAAELVLPLYRRGAPATAAAELLISEAAARWKEDEGDYRDDITAVCLKVSEVVADLKAQAK